MGVLTLKCLPSVLTSMFVRVRRETLCWVVVLLRGTLLFPLMALGSGSRFPRSAF